MVWENVENKRHDIIFHNTETPETLAVFYWKARKLWYVESNRNDVGILIETKSKKKAVEVAKKYMRTH